MANVSHASLTGTQLHEPKGADTATLGTVYVSNGAGSGSWSSVGTSSFTGMIVDFAAPVAPTGWLELNGSVISTTTYSALYGVMSIQSSGTKTNSSTVVTSIPDTSNFRVGYYIYGTGITSGSTIVSIDSASQVTISNAATSSGSSSFAVSPWLLGSGTIQLPDVTTNGRFRRSRTSATAVGQVQAPQNLNHTHTLTAIPGTTDSQGNHNHTITITDPGHAHSFNPASPVVLAGGSGQDFASGTGQTKTILSMNGSTTGITASASTTGAHTHNVTVTGTSDNSSASGTDLRPYSLIVLTCVKT